VKQQFVFVAKFHTVSEDNKKLEKKISINSKKLLKIQRNSLKFGKPKTGKKNLLLLIKKIEDALIVMPQNNQDKM
jgi:hypothetical protein